MIYTITFNPALDYIAQVENFKIGEINRTKTETILPGGKGLNVSIVLKNLGIENTALGLTFAMFSTWMNGMVSNYFTKPGQYAGGPTTVEQDRDGSGNLLFMDKHGVTVIGLDNKGEKTYIYEETGEPVTDLEGMVPIMKEVPLVV